MAYQVTKQAIKLQLSNGETAEGKALYVNINFANMSPNFDPSTSTDRTKLLAIISPLENCLSKTLNSIQAVTTGTVTGE